jgi:hypothetical protein
MLDVAATDLCMYTNKSHGFIKPDIMVGKTGYKQKTVKYVIGNRFLYTVKISFI